MEKTKYNVTMTGTPERKPEKKSPVRIPNMDVRRVIARFNERTSMHGCSYYQTSHHPVAKVFWVAVTIAATAVVVVHCYMIINQFLTWPKSTKVSLGFHNLRFPAVTICNVNPIKKSMVPHYGTGQLYDLVKAIDPYRFIKLEPNSPGDGSGPGGDDTNSSDTTDQPPSTGRRKRFVDDFTNINWQSFDNGSTPLRSGHQRTKKLGQFLAPDDLSTDMDSTSIMTELFRFLYMQMDRRSRVAAGHNMSEMLLACSFNGMRCYASNFTLYQTPSYGNCFTLDASRMVAKRPGPEGGLTLVLFLQTHEFVNGFTNGYGSRLIVHNHGTKPLPDEEGTFVSAASETNIALRQTSISRLGGRYGNCSDGKEFEKKYGIAYSLKMCHVTCLAMQIVDACGCWNHMHENIMMSALAGKNTRQCNTMDDRECQLDVFRLDTRKELDCGCQNPCEDVQYDMSISSRQWPTTQFAMMLRLGLCEVDPESCDKVPLTELWKFSNNFAKLNIYYETLNYESIVEEPLIDPFTFMASIGGALGLWIGLSMLSVCEVLQLLLELALCLVNKCRQSGTSKTQA